MFRLICGCLRRFNWHYRVLDLEKRELLIISNINLLKSKHFQDEFQYKIPKQVYYKMLKIRHPQHGELSEIKKNPAHTPTTVTP